MSYQWVDRGRWMLGALLVLGWGGFAAAGTVVIDANTAYPGGNPPDYGDFRTSNGVITGSTGWSYTNVGGGATVGINTTFADAAGGNGSVYFATTSGSSKADVQYRPGTLLNPTSLGGTLNELTTFGYDWYRDSVSTNSGAQAPSLRLILNDGSLFGTVTLVFEPVYNGGSNPLPTDSWVSSDALDDGDAVYWQTGNSDLFKDLDYWKSQYGDYNVIGLSFGVGSGWNGTFTGAVDNVRIGFNGAEATVFDFEVSGAPSPAVPEPSSVALGLIAGAAGLALAARRRRSA